MRDDFGNFYRLSRTFRFLGNRAHMCSWMSQMCRCSWRWHGNCEDPQRIHWLEKKDCKVWLQIKRGKENQRYFVAWMRNQRAWSSGHLTNNEIVGERWGREKERERDSGALTSGADSRSFFQSQVRVNRSDHVISRPNQTCQTSA